MKLFFGIGLVGFLIITMNSSCQEICKDGPSQFCKGAVYERFGPSQK